MDCIWCFDLLSLHQIWILISRIWWIPCWEIDLAVVFWHDTYTNMNMENFLHDHWEINPAIVFWHDNFASNTDINLVNSLYDHLEIGPLGYCFNLLVFHQICISMWKVPCMIDAGGFGYTVRARSLLFLCMPSSRPARGQREGHGGHGQRQTPRPGDDAQMRLLEWRVLWALGYRPEYNPLAPVALKTSLHIYWYLLTRAFFFGGGGGWMYQRGEFCTISVIFNEYPRSTCPWNGNSIP